MMPILSYYFSDMKRTLWVERKFTFDFPEGWIFNILERLRGTTPRILDITNYLTDDHLSYQMDNKWSIKEHIGHLYDLEFLHIKRIQQIKNSLPELTGADMSNQLTNESKHNDQTVENLINSFNEKRLAFLAEFENLSDDDQYFKSLHPRLRIFMRPVDLAYFTAEHDDHHLRSMRALVPGGL